MLEEAGILRRIRELENASYNVDEERLTEAFKRRLQGFKTNEVFQMGEMQLSGSSGTIDLSAEFKGKAHYWDGGPLYQVIITPYQNAMVYVTGRTDTGVGVASTASGARFGYIITARARV